jgi:ubiquinone/menaquinone biosynthesis C-methylase UbiE
MNAAAVDRPADITTAFDTGAASYDRLVGANPGYHEHLRLSARRMRLPEGGRGLRLLDAGCGTGASTAALVAVAPQAEIIAVDGSTGMLAEAKAKRWPPTVRFLQSHIEDLGDAGIAGPFDGILAAYLIRNLADPDAALQAFRAMLRPGATLAVHEYSVRDSRLATVVWNLVCTTVVIPSGRLRSGDAGLYKYLRRSVNGFDGAAAFRNRLQAAGFTAVRAETMPGWQHNIVHTFLGQAPQ